MGAARSFARTGAFLAFIFLTWQAAEGSTRCQSFSNCQDCATAAWCEWCEGAVATPEQGVSFCKDRRYACASGSENTYFEVIDHIHECDNAGTLSRLALASVTGSVGLCLGCIFGCCCVLCMALLFRPLRSACLKCFDRMAHKQSYVRASTTNRVFPTEQFEGRDQDENNHDLYGTDIESDDDALSLHFSEKHSVENIKSGLQGVRVDMGAPSSVGRTELMPIDPLPALPEKRGATRSAHPATYEPYDATATKARKSRKTTQ